MIDNPTNCPPQVRVGDIKAFAAARPAWQNRLAVAPEIPTVEEAGLPGFYLSHWHGLWVAPSWRLWQIQPCVSASPTLARKFLRATSGRRKRSALSKKTEIEKWCRIFALFEARFLKQNPAEAGLVVNQNRQSLRFLMHAVFHERAPLKKVDGRVFLLGLHLALSLKLGHPRVLSLGGCVRRHGERAGKQARSSQWRRQPDLKSDNPFQSGIAIKSLTFSTASTHCRQKASLSSSPPNSLPSWWLTAPRRTWPPVSEAEPISSSGN